MVAFEWTTDVWAQASIAVIGAIIAVFLARLVAIRTNEGPREGLRSSWSELQRELNAIDRLDKAILKCAKT